MTRPGRRARAQGPAAAEREVSGRFGPPVSRRTARTAYAPLGLLAAGPLAAAVGTGHALAGCAALVILATAMALLSPQVRTLRDPAEARSVPAAPTASAPVKNPADEETPG